VGIEGSLHRSKGGLWQNKKRWKKPAVKVASSIILEG